MEYLFFDLEFATQEHGKSKICEFGYVITNEKFEVLERDNFIINPNIRDSEWNLTVLSEILTKSKIVYENGYTFDECYLDIKDIFEEVDMVFGHTTYCDAKAINDELQRYEFPPIDFVFYDVCELYKYYAKTDRSYSVSDIVKKLDMIGEDSLHDAGTDAFNTMLILKGLCQKMNINATQLIELCPECRDETIDYVIQSLEKRYLQQEEQLLDTLDGDETNKMEPHSVNLIRFLQFLDNVKVSKKGTDKLKNMVVAFSMEYERTHYKEMLNLVQLIVNEGGEYTSNAIEANLFVSYNVLDKKGNIKICPRYKYILGRDTTKVSIITLEQFLSKLEITEEELNMMPRVSFDFIFDENAKIKSSTDKETIRRLKAKGLV